MHIATLDGAVIVASYGAADLILGRSGGIVSDSANLPLILVAALGAHHLTLHRFGLYRRMWRHAGIVEARDVAMSCADAMALLAVIVLAGRAVGVGQVSPVVIVLGALLTTLGVEIVRFRTRLATSRRRHIATGMRVAVIGCRDAGASAVRDMLMNPGAGLVPVAVFDDDGRAHGLSLLGVPVVGPIAAIAEAKTRFGIEQVILAIPSPSPTLVHRTLCATEAAGLPMKLLPGIREMAGGKATSPLQPPRQFRIEELLGRDPVTTDLQAVHSSLRGSRVLISGAGGSIGSEISRQVAQFGPDLIILLDRDETHLHDVASVLTGASVQELGDIRDPDVVFDVFHRHRPSVVFHAAAHKHVPILEAHPIEAAKTNVFGTLNMVEAAAAHGVSRFVMISTDKAVRPTSVMGAAKLVGERILLAQEPSVTTFCAVRFGNVLGSRGSVIPTFVRQIAAGGPVTVTDPLMTRFFMTIEESVQLVLQASLLATGGDVFMLDMGEPVSILDLAQRMIALSGYRVGTEIEIEFVGGRPGERFSEELSAPDEEILRTAHPSILRLAPPAVHSDMLAKDLLRLQESVSMRDVTRVRHLLFALAGPVAQLARSTVSKVPA
ncbi:MAG TPA: nucleoside-diphosphate sugar epimerase/dehydratase [Acidimicrobiales bacterium]|nr:nucleoside-diphosphate sugar epimerase/dehydratase [Acidimicrobiales bacterium]